MSKAPAILFDLDGTLLDTAPDLTATMNQLLATYQRPPISIDQLRPYISFGSLGMLRHCFHLPLHDPELARLRREYIALHAENDAAGTHAFAGVTELIATLMERGYRFGIVTNKTFALAEQALSKFAFAKASACLIGADSLPHCKPHPAPLLHAASLLNMAPQQCLYVGDAKTDMEAAIASNMAPVLATYGYLPHEAAIDTWGAKHLIQTPLELLDIL